MFNKISTWCAVAGLVIAFACLPFMTGCTEAEQADAMEFWFGIPNNNRTPPKSAVLEDQDGDGPKVKKYKEFARKQYEKYYQEAPNRAVRDNIMREIETKAVQDIGILSMNDSGHISDREALIMLNQAEQQQMLQSEIRSLNRSLNRMY